MRARSSRRLVATLLAAAGASFLASCSESGTGADDPPAAGRGDDPSAALEPGIAIAFVYDTSGSMREPVLDGRGGSSPKWTVANRAFLGIVERIEAYVSAAPPGAKPRLETALIEFSGENVSVALPMAPFDAGRFRTWISKFRAPGDHTPLGRAVALASAELLRSNLATKHMVVLTDGKNTTGPDPADELRRARSAAELRQVALSSHFVAFDVAAEEFRRVRDEGAEVFSAADEKELNERMQYVLEEKILLEVDRPHPAGGETK